MTEAHDIVPEGFDLASARSDKTTTPSEDQPRCPYCRTVNISHKTGHYFGSNHRKDGEWRCNRDGCSSHFDEPIRGDDE